MRRIQRLLAVLFTSLPLSASAIDAAAVLAASSAGETGEGEGRVPYQLYTPEKSEGPLPLVLCLHGAGGRGSDNTTQVTDTWWAPNVLVAPESQEVNPCFVLMPQCGNDRRWADYDWEKGSYRTGGENGTPELESTIALVRELAARPEVDASRIYITGLSMGGYGTWDALARYPKLFAAAIPICGAGDTSLAGRFAALPIWVFHGDADTAVPVAGSRDMVAALKAAGSPVKYTEYQGVGHNSWQPAWKEDKLVPWLFSQRKK